MKSEKFEALAIDFLRGSLDDNEEGKFRQLLENDRKLKKEFEDLQSTWQTLRSVNTPPTSDKMDARFYEFLNSQTDNQNTVKGNRFNWPSRWFLLKKPEYAIGLLLLAVGVLGGYLINDGEKERLVENSPMADNRETQEKLVLTLLDQPSANQRLDGVSEANKIKDVDVTIINALLKTLNNDANVNVRLAAIESLTNYVDRPEVRQGLVQSISHQESPIVQVTLANLMLALQEKRSIEPFKRLLETKELDTTVKRKLENTIQSII